MVSAHVLVSLTMRVAEEESWDFGAEAQTPFSVLTVVCMNRFIVLVNIRSHCMFAYYVVVVHTVISYAFRVLENSQ